MTTQSSSPAHFPSRIGRRLSLAFAAFIAIVLVVGGIALTLVVRINSTNHLIDKENSHILVIGQVYLTFNEIISRLDEIEETGKLDQMEHVQALHKKLEQHLRTFLTLHQGDQDPSYEQESALLSDLGNLATELQTFTNRVATDPGHNRRSGPGGVDVLNLTSHRISRIVEDLSSFHRLRITSLLQGSESMLQAIVTLYLAFILVSGGLIAVSGIAVNRGIASPLRKLGDAATGIAEGRLDERVPVRSLDEIGQLSHAFNVMADRLQAREQELRAAHDQLQQKVHETQALYQIGTEISALHELDRILESVLENARELLRTEAVALCLMKPGQDESRVRATSGPPEAFRPGVQSAPCIPLLREGIDVQNLPCPVISPVYLQAHIAAPLRRGDSVIGRICVAGRQPRRFTPAEADLLTGLATQASIAIENARLYEEVRNLATIEERDRLARELHDGLAQALALLHLKLDHVREQAASADFSQIAAAVQEMAAITVRAYDDLRHSIFGLRTKVPRELGLIPGLSKYLHDFSLQNAIAVEFEADDGQAIRLPPASEVQLIRIVQEALANVRKHSGARQARVRLRRQDSLIHVTIEDDGRGFDPDILAGTDPRHIGLQTMRERAEAVGGRLEINTGPGRGTRIVVTLQEGG